MNLSINRQEYLSNIKNKFQVNTQSYVNSSMCQISSTVNSLNSIKQSNQYYKYFDQHDEKNNIKMSIRDSILVEDKENCYIPNNGSCFDYTIETKIESSFCHNHVNQKAEYYVKPEDGQQFKYCNKCASLLINQGFKVNRIDTLKTSRSQNKVNQSINQLKKQQLNSIWLQFESIYQDVLFKKNQTDFSILSNQSFYNQQIQQVNIYFQELHSYLQILKNKFYNKILQQKQNVIKKSQQWSNTFCELLKQIESIESDIQINPEGIILLQQNQYFQFTQVLVEHLKQYRNITNSWKLDDLSNKQHVIPNIQQTLQSIKNVLMFTPGGMLKTPRNSLLSRNTSKQRLDDHKFMGKSNSCVFVKNSGIFQRKYSQMIVQ